MPERRFWFFRTTIQAFCLVIEKGAVDYCVLSILKGWQEYIELYKTELHDPDNHDGVITHLETEILE